MSQRGAANQQQSTHTHTQFSLYYYCRKHAPLGWWQGFLLAFREATSSFTFRARDFLVFPFLHEKLSLFSK
jgi:hypothetical protein